MLRNAGGCTFAADPALDCARARYLWTADADPRVLRARIACSKEIAEPSIDISALHRCELRRDSSLHLRLKLFDGDLRLDLIDCLSLPKMAAIEPALDFARSLEPQLSSVRRLHALTRGACLKPRGQRVAMLVEALRVSDAVRSGASLREIGLGIHGGDWPGDGEHLKSRVRRRVYLSQALKRAGPRRVLAAEI